MKLNQSRRKWKSLHSKDDKTGKKPGQKTTKTEATKANQNEDHNQEPEEAKITAVQ
jgi:hypothetical protein